MGELRPCPFCGCEYEKAEDDVWWAGSHAEWCPLNNQFPGQIGNLIVPDEKECIDAWNRRAPDTDTVCGAWKACWEKLEANRRAGDAD